MGSLHARVIAQSQEAGLGCVVDPNPAAGSALAERFRSRWVPDLDDFTQFDAVIVASPTNTHAQWVHRALESGKPVLVEKPMSENIDESVSMVEEAQRRRVPMMCGFLERYNPAVITALDIIDEPVHLSTVRHSPYAPRIPTGVGHDLLIHDVDLVLRIAGGLPGRITAHLLCCHPDSEKGAEDVVDVNLQFDERFLASLSASRVSQRKGRTLTISDLDRLVEVDLIRQDRTVYRHMRNEPLSGGPGYRQQTIIEIPSIHDPREPLASQLDHLMDLVRGEAEAEREINSLLGPHLVVHDLLGIAARDDRFAPAGAPSA